MEEVTQTICAAMGNGLSFVFGIFLLMFSINVMYISAKGIKKLDAYFEDGKDYNDTWSLAASYRFFHYCSKFLRGQLPVKHQGIRWWMYFNTAGYYLLSGYIILASLVYCYLKISSWLT